jgi:phosphatidylglycerophosphatase A
MMKRLVMSGFGLGYAPFASGTFGSAGAIAIGLAVWALFAPFGNGWLNVAWILLTLAASVGCVWGGRWCVDYYAGRCRKEGDPGQVVIDEFAGQWIALVGLPFAGRDRFGAVLAIFAVQFFLFRLFDVIKPPPARQLERFGDGWGILLDDLAAGVYANVIGQIIFRAFGGLGLISVFSGL